MRSRWLKPEFFNDRKMAQFSPLTLLVYQSLWCLADDGGGGNADPVYIKGLMFSRWSAAPVPEIGRSVLALVRAGRLTLHRAGDETYYQIVNWEKHQTVHKASKFRNPRDGSPVDADTYDKECGTSATSGGEYSGTSEAPLPTSPPLRHLDSYTPRHLDKSIPDSGESAPKKRNGKRPPDKHPHFPMDVCVRLHQEWEATGRSMDMGRFRKTLAVLYPAQGPRFDEATMLKGIEGFAELAEQDGPERANLWHLNRFVDNIGIYVEWGLMPVSNPDRTPTARGAKIIQEFAL